MKGNGVHCESILKGMLLSMCAALVLCFLTSASVFASVGNVPKMWQSDAGTDEVIVKWNKAQNAVQYQWAYSTEKNGTYVEYPASSFSSSLTAYFHDLKPGTSYWVKVRAISKTEKGGYSEPMEVVTCPVKVSGITQVSATASSAGFTISGASGATGFEVTYYPSNEKNLTRTVKVNSRDVVLEDLKEVYGKYTLSIKPYRKAETGTSAIGASKQLSNAVGTLPGSVFGLNYSNSSRYPNTITVKWQKRYVCDGYQIMLLKEDAVTVETTWTVFNGSTQSTDIKVSECGNYYVKIRGYISFNGENHYGPWSDLVKCSTKYPGHVYNNPVETKEPTKTSEGVRTYKCAYCTSQKTETIPALNGKTENSSTDTSSTGSNAPEWSGKAEIKLSSGRVRRGRKTTIKITGSSPAKLTVKGVNSLAKNKKYVKIKNGKTAKLVFTKNAPKGKYKFKVISPAVGYFDKSTKTVTVRVK